MSCVLPAINHPSHVSNPEDVKQREGCPGTMLTIACCYMSRWFFNLCVVVNVSHRICTNL